MPSWQTAGVTHGTGGGGGVGAGVGVNQHIAVYVSGTKIQSASRSQVLAYSRRNGGNNWNLGRGRGGR